MNFGEMSLRVCATAIIAAVAGCAEAPGDAGKPAHDARAPSGNRLFMAPECRENSPGIAVDASRMIFGAAGTDSLCVVPDGRAEFVAGHAQIRMYRGDRFAVHLRCDSDKAHDAFYASNAGRRVILVGKDRALGVFHVPASPRSAGCGRVDVESMGDAMALCEAAAHAWGLPAETCLEPCGPDGTMCVYVPSN